MVEVAACTPRSDPDAALALVVEAGWPADASELRVHRVHLPQL